MRLKLIVLVALLLACVTAGLGQTPPATSGTAQRLLRDAQQHLSEKRPELAIPEFEVALALDPANLDAQANLGVLLYFKGDFAQAAPHLRAAVRGKPDLWRIQALLGLAEMRLKDASKARLDLETALPHLKGEKVQREVGNALVESYTATGELEKAAAAVSVMLESQPTDSGLLLMAYRLYSDVSHKAMLTLAMAAPQSAEMHQVMAIELGRHGDRAAAMAHYREALRINPNLPGLHFQFGNLLYSSIDPKLQSEAEAEFRAALAVNPQDEKAQLMPGMVANRRGDLKAAYVAYARAVEMQPNDADACTELAKILITMNELEKARALLVHAVEIDPTAYTAYYRLSTLDRQQGRLEEARRELGEYQKYKDLKEKLRSLFHDIPLQLEAKAADEDEMPK